MTLFPTQYGPWAVITGAARGLGQGIAEECASLGLNVILIDILEKELEQTAHNISSSWPIETKTILADLANPIDIPRVLQECAPYTVGLFCCNHAATHLFPDNKLKFWLDTPITELRQMLQVNLMSSFELIFSFAQKMRTQKRGGLLFISSGSCLSGAPYVGQYAATKAFLTNLGETLWWELKHDNIDVTTLITGLTKTPGMLRFINPIGLKKMPMMQPREVARIALNYLGQGPIVIPGWRNKLHSFLTRCLLPRKFSIAFLGKMLSQFFHVLPTSKKESLSRVASDIEQKF
jgi:short-subunit dehydrogenase